jgi:hypothetical protein
MGAEQILSSIQSDTVARRAEAYCPTPKTEPIRHLIENKELQLNRANSCSRVQLWPRACNIPGRSNKLSKIPRHPRDLKKVPQKRRSP